MKMKTSDESDKNDAEGLQFFKIFHNFFRERIILGHHRWFEWQSKKVFEEGRKRIEKKASKRFPFYSLHITFCL